MEPDAQPRRFRAAAGEDGRVTEVGIYGTFDGFVVNGQDDRCDEVGEEGEQGDGEAAPQDDLALEVGAARDQPREGAGHAREEAGHFRRRLRINFIAGRLVSVHSHLPPDKSRQ